MGQPYFYSEKIEIKIGGERRQGTRNVVPIQVIHVFPC